MLQTFSLLMLVLLGLCLPPAALAQADNDLDEVRSRMGSEWVLTQNDRKRNIKTYARLEDGKRYRSFRIEAVLDADVGALAQVLLDFESYTKWYWKTRESKLLRQNTQGTDFMVYMVHEAPYGLPDRDVILRGIVEPQTRTKRELTIKVSAEPETLPARPPLVRMPAEDMSVKFVPQADHKVLLEVTGYFDAGGNVPVWAANFVQRNAPYAVILGLQRMAERDEYKKSKRPLGFAVYRYEDYL